VTAYYSVRDTTTLTAPLSTNSTITSANPYFTPIGTETSQGVTFDYTPAFGAVGTKSPARFTSWGITPSSEIKIGDMVLSDVFVLTEPVGDDDGGPTPPGQSIDGTLSLPALEQLGWAIVPSKGVVRFVPASDAAALVSSVGGTAYDYTSKESTITKVGKKKVYSYPRAIRIPATIAGQESPQTVVGVEWWTGYVQPSPWLAIANKQLELMAKFMAEIGLTPSARSRLSVQMPRGPKPWDYPHDPEGLIATPWEFD